MLQLTALLLLQAHQEKLCWGNQVQRVTLGMLVLKVFLVSEGSLGSLDIQGAVISLDVTGQVEEVSPDYLSAKVVILELVSLVTSFKLGRDLCSSFRHCQSCKSLLCKAIRMIHVQFVWIKASSVDCSSAILHRLTHNCSSSRAGGVIMGVSSVLNVPSNVSMVCKEEQYLSSYAYISWRLSCTKPWEMKKITGTKQKIYKGKELILHHSFSVLDTDLFVCSVASSPFHTQILSPDGWCGGS